MQIEDFRAASAAAIVTAAVHDAANVLAAAKIARDGELSKPVKLLYRAGRITFDDVAAVKRLMADLRVATEGCGDISQINWGFVDEEGEEEDEGDRLDTEPCLYALVCASVGIHDHRTRRASPPGTSVPFHRRKMIRVLAPASIAAAKRAVDEEVGEGACRMLVEVASGLSFSAVARREGITDKTVAADVALAAKALRRHYLAEDRRPEFARWARGEQPTPGWRQTADGAEVVLRCQHTGPSVIQPARGVFVPDLAEAQTWIATVFARDEITRAVDRSDGNILREAIEQKIRKGVAEIMTAVEIERQRSGAAAVRAMIALLPAVVVPRERDLPPVMDHKKLSNEINDLDSENGAAKCDTNNMSGTERRASPDNLNWTDTTLAPLPAVRPA